MNKSFGKNIILFLERVKMSVSSHIGLSAKQQADSRTQTHSLSAFALWRTESIALFWSLWNLLVLSALDKNAPHSY